MQIHSAARRGDIDSIQFCLDRGVNVDQRDRNERNTPLVDALTFLRATHPGGGGPRATIETIRFLLDAGANPNAVCELGRTPLYAAAASGSIEVVRLLCERGADPFHASECNYTTALAACFQRSSPGKRDVIRHLAGLGVSLDAASSYGESPLNQCIYYGDFETVRVLIELGASVAALGWNELHTAVALGTLDDLKQAPCPPAALEHRIRRWEFTPLHLAIAVGDLEKVACLVERGASLAVNGRFSDTPLHIAAKYDSAAVVKWLLDSGGGVDPVNEFGNTPLMEACESGSLAAAEVLIGTGASVSLRDHVDESAIHHADSFAIVKLLVERGGAEINSVDGCGSWPLKEAAERNDIECTEWLLAHGAEVDITSTGATALHDAVLHDSREVAALLLAHGADPNAPDVDGDKPLYWVQSREMVELFSRYGAGLSATELSTLVEYERIKDPLILEVL